MRIRFPGLAVLAAALATLAIAACQRQNPRYCTRANVPCGDDGSSICREVRAGVFRCTEPECRTNDECGAPRPPFCDPADHTCKACTLDSQCQGRAGTPRCFQNACVACVAAADCAGRAEGPVCDAGNFCRPCRLHAECGDDKAPGVCAKADLFPDGALPAGVRIGECVAASKVLVVDQEHCSGMEPWCTDKVLGKLSDAVPFARFRPTPTAGSAVPGIDTDKLTTDPAHVYLIGAWADQDPWQAQRGGRYPTVIGFAGNEHGVMISGRRRVTIEGMLPRSNKEGVACVGPGGGGAGVHVLRSVFGENQTAIAVSAGCALRLEQSWLGRGVGAFAGMKPNFVLAVDAAGARVHIADSVFWHNGTTTEGKVAGVRLAGQEGLAGDSAIVNSSFVAQAEHEMGPINLGCDLPGDGKDLYVLNSYFYNGLRDLTGITQIDPNCRSAMHMAALASDDPAVVDKDGLLLANDTGVVDLQEGDFHLRPDAPARLRRGGVRALDKVAAPAVDLEGRPRSQDHPSIGAYEAPPGS